MKLTKLNNLSALNYHLEYRWFSSLSDFVFVNWPTCYNLFGSPKSKLKSPSWSFTDMSVSQSVSQLSHSVVSDSLWLHGPQHTRPPCPSPTPRVYTNSYPLSRWCHTTISSSVIPFSSCPQSFPASGSFQISQLFTSGGQNIGVWTSTSDLPMNTQAWSPLV